MKEDPTTPPHLPRRVTLKDIAKTLNVSHATVSRALNGTNDSLISEATRQRVHKAAEEMGYRPNHAGRALVTGRTGLLALWLWSQSTQNSYHSTVSQLMQAEAQNRGYQLLVDVVGHNTLNAPARGVFDRWNVDGIVAHESGPAIEATFGDRNKPFAPVVATGGYQLLSNVDAVRFDLSDGVYEAITHLLNTGRKRILHITEQVENRGTDSRMTQYCEMLSAAGLPIELLEAPADRARTREIVRAYVAERGCPDALYCHTDDMAIAAYRALCDLGLRVPEDAAIVGCNGIEDTEYLEVPITTIVLPLAEMSRLACDFLERRISDPNYPRQEAILKAKLEIRASTNPRSR